MPLIEGRISDLTDDVAVKLEQAITAAVRDAVAVAFPAELGFERNSAGYQVGLEIARKIMPGWTWVTMSRHTWAIQGRRPENAIIARIHILVLQNALESQYKDHILEAVTRTVKDVLGAGGKKLHLAVSIIEGGVEMTLPRDLFADLMHEVPEELLQASNVRNFLMTEILRELQARRQIV